MFRVISCALVAVVVSGHSSQGQGPPGQPKSQAPTFRSGVDLVQLDVSVIDKKTHLPIRGLKQENFTVFEDGKPQSIAGFAAVDVPDPPALPVVNGTPVTWMRDVTPDVQSNLAAAGNEGRLIVMILDDAMIPLEPSIVQRARQAARGVIDKLSPADRVAVVLTAESKHAQDFTNSRAKLLAAVEGMHPGYATYQFGWNDYTPPVSGAFQPPVQTDNDIGVREMSFNTLVSVAEALMAAPERRKMLFYISPGIPVSFAAGRPKLADGSGLASTEANKRLATEMPELFRRMQRANVAVYPIDPTGGSGMGPVVTAALNSVPAVASGAHIRVDPVTGELLLGSAPPPPGRNPAARNPTDRSEPSGTPDPGDFGHFVANLDLNFLQAAAANTGGRAIVNTNDVVPGIGEIFQENGSFYLIGYQPPPTDPPGTLHRLTVKVDRPDAEVRTRSGFYTPKPDKIDGRLTPVSKAVAGLLPSPHLPLQVALAPIAPRTRGQSDPIVTIVLGLECAATTPAMSDTVDIQIAVFTPDGLPRGTTNQQVTVALKPSMTAEPLRYQTMSQIKLKPGRYQLRIAAHSARTSVTGSVFADIDVPDFAKEPLSLSGVLVTTEPRIAFAPKAAFSDLVPLIPTVERTFTKTTRASAFLRVYQGGAGPLSLVTIKTRIINEAGSAALNDTVTPSVDMFDAATRAYDYRLEIPVTTLAAGQYLLALEATLGGTTVRRYVRFTVN